MSTLTSNPVDVTKLLAFVRQAGFSKRHRFYRALQDRIAVKLDDPSIVPAWPDALNLVNDEDWATAYHAVFGDVALPLVQSSDDTCEPYCRCRQESGCPSETCRNFKECTSQKADPQHGAKARDFVEYDSEGGVRIDLARYLRTPAGQAQLEALGGKKAEVVRQPRSTRYCDYDLCADTFDPAHSNDAHEKSEHEV